MNLQTRKKITNQTQKKTDFLAQRVLHISLGVIIGDRYMIMINNIFDSSRFYSFIKTIKNLRVPSSNSIFYINKRYGHVSITEKAYYNKIKLDNFICCCYSISDLPHNQDNIHPMYACKNIKIDKNNMI